MAERKPLLLRLSPELHEEVRRLAAADFRSVNAEIEVLLREAIRRRTGGEPAPERTTE
ncbi:MAG TPA: Arc family DNA-binding protein [Fimbriimonadaceae bacterium]|nr:Arc family DNA-binding protein [Fimbriimonadaceae bacterium]